MAALVLALSGLAARQLKDPLAPPLLPLADTDLSRSALLLSDPAAPAAVRARALAFARAARDEAPARAETWLALAYAQARADRAMSPAALDDLARSYRLAPLDPDAAQGRLVLALDVWDQLTPPLRADALAEIDALWLRCAPDILDALQHNLPNAEGRLGLNAEITRAELAWMRQHGQGQDRLDQADGGLEARRCQS